MGHTQKTCAMSRKIKTSSSTVTRTLVNMDLLDVFLQGVILPLCSILPLAALTTTPQYISITPPQLAQDLPFTLRESLRHRVTKIMMTTLTMMMTTNLSTLLRLNIAHNCCDMRCAWIISYLL